MFTKICSFPCNVILHQNAVKPSMIRNTYCTIPEKPEEKPKKKEDALKQVGILGHAGTPQEEGYFYNRQKEEMQKLKDKLKNTAKAAPEDQK